MKVVRLAGSGAIQLSNQAPAKEWPEGGPVGARWNADWVPLHDALVELVHATGDNRLIEEMRNPGDLIGRSSLDEGWFLDADAVIKTRRANDAFVKGPDLDEKVAALTASPKCDADATWVIAVRIGFQVAGVVRLPAQKL